MTLASKLLQRARKRRTYVHLDLLMRPGCHLCDDARIALAREFGDGSVQEIDITADGDLEAEFVFRIPVVLHGGRVVAEGMIDRQTARLLRRELRRVQRDERRSV